MFNHSGRDFFAFRDLREKREQSAYRDWYCDVNFQNNNEYGDGFSYANWGEEAPIMVEGAFVECVLTNNTIVAARGAC